MPPSLKQRLIKNSFLLALLLHLLFFLSISLVLTVHPDDENKHTPDYVPAYTFTQAPPVYTPAMSASQSATEQSASQEKVSQPKPKQAEVSDSARKLFLNESSWYPQETLLTSSKKVIQDEQTQQTMQDLKHIEPMLMIGDSSQASDPIMQILGRALSAHFKYPKMEDAFRVSGRVIVAMVLHPEGNFTNVRIVETSNNQDFDNAALYAVNAAPNAKGADRFLKEPKYFVVGFIFGGDPRFYKSHS